MRHARLLALFAVTTIFVTNTAMANPQDLVLTESSGARHAVKEYSGRWVLVNYWATWCADCIKEMPALSKLAVQTPKLEILGVTDETITPDKLSAFSAKHPVSYPIGQSAKETIPRELTPSLLGVQVRPMSYLIAPNGTVAARYIGTIDVEKLRRLVEAPAR